MVMLKKIFPRGDTEKMINEIRNIPNISVIKTANNKLKFYGMTPKHYTKLREIIAEHGCEIIHHTAYRTNHNEIIDVIEVS